MNLETLRKKIDALDEKILALLNDRANIAVEVGKFKIKTQDTTFYKPEREKEVISNVLSHNEGPLTNEQLAHIFKSIMSSCRALEQQLKIGYLGPEGSFCHVALLKNFGLEVEAIPAKTISDTIALLEQGRVEFAVVPIENSTHGVVNETLDALVNSPVKMIAEIIIPIKHHLWGTENDAMPEKIYGHPQALAQCQRYLREHYPNAEEISVASTAFGVKKVKEEGLGLAIGSDLAGELYDLQCIAENIQDSSHNQTRFVILGKKEIKATGKDKTSVLVMNIPNESKALLKLVEPFARFNVNISLPSLRPSKDEAWHYIFYFDLTGHITDEPIQNALNELKKFALVKVLGSYPAAWPHVL